MTVVNNTIEHYFILHIPVNRCFGCQNQNRLAVDFLYQLKFECMSFTIRACNRNQFVTLVVGCAEISASKLGVYINFVFRFFHNFTFYLTYKFLKQ